MGCSEDHLLERVLRDPRDARRFYVTYRTLDRKMTATRKGFYIGTTHIKPTDGNTTGYIPFPPYYIDKLTLDELLTPYGHVVTGEFVETALHTRIGGYKFTFIPKKNTVPPKTLEYNDCVMDVKYDDDLRQCHYCHRYGHLVHQCRTKAADDQHHKQRRALEKEQATSEWKSDREAVRRKGEQERLTIQRQYTTLLNASADVYQSAIITLEQADSSPEQIAAIKDVYERDQQELHDQRADTVEYVDQETADAVRKLDEQYTLTTGEACPPSPNRTLSIGEISDVDDDDMDLDADTIAQAETRFTSKLAAFLPPPPEALPAAIPATTDTTDVHVPSEPSPAIPATTSPPFVFQQLPSTEQKARIASASAALPTSFNFPTSSQYIIQFRTRARGITAAVHAELFNLKSHPGYGFVNPMETVSRIAEGDPLMRHIYVPDKTVCTYVNSFLSNSTCKEWLDLLSPITFRENEHYKPP